MAFGLHNNLFNQIDANHDGMIDLNEMRNFAIFQQADRNHDGRITLQEFAQTAAPQLGINPLQTRAVFHAADLNNDGVLSREELNNIADFKHADLNHDGRVDPLEMQIYRNKAMIGLGPIPPPGPARNAYNSHQYSYSSSYTTRRT